MFFTRDKSFYSSLVKLAIPIALQNAVTFAVNFADNLMIGSLGDSAISGVYVGNQLQTLLQMFIGGIEGAILILAAQYWGKRDTNTIKKIVATGVHFSVVIGALISLIAILFPSYVMAFFIQGASVIEMGTPYVRVVGMSYLFFCISQVMVASMRAVETAKIGLYVSFMTLGVNVILNYVLIFGKLGLPALGVTGAAIATLISRILEAVVMVVYVRGIDKKLKLRFTDLMKSDRRIVHDFIKYGLPLMGGQIVWSVNMLAQTWIFGRFDGSVMTATSITGQLHNMMYIAMNGLSSAVGIITGKTVGAGRLDKIREYSRTTQVIFICVGLLSGLAVHLLRDPFIALYTDASPEAVEYSRQFINVISITIIGTCYQAACLFGLVKSGGDISFVFKNDTIFVFLVVLPSGLLATFLGAPAWVVYACLKCDQILKCFVALVKINRYNWMKNLTRDNMNEEPAEPAEALEG
ncbi:MAG: MATE family efflux transporter [Clostridia bacterium]|nr:MATE family efflux transporter [Clostridia bacterium]